FVLDESDTGCAVGVVLDPDHSGLAPLVALEVHNPVAPLVAAAAVARRDAAVVVAATALLKRGQQALLRLALRDIREVIGDGVTPAGGCWLVFLQSHRLGPLKQLDRLARGEGDYRFLRVRLLR